MKYLAPLSCLIIMAYMLTGCSKGAKSSDPLPDTGSGGLTLSQTESLLLGYWQTPNIVPITYYDANGNVLATVPSSNPAPYLWIYTSTQFGTTYYEFRSSNARDISPSSVAYTFDATISVGGGSTVANGFSGTDPISSLSSATLVITEPYMAVPQTYTLNGVVYPFSSAKETFTYTRYTL
jgi:hypothetical protein